MSLIVMLIIRIVKAIKKAKKEKAEGAAAQGQDQYGSRPPYASDSDFAQPSSRHKSRKSDGRIRDRERDQYYASQPQLQGGRSQAAYADSYPQSNGGHRHHRPEARFREQDQYYASQPQIQGSPYAYAYAPDPKSSFAPPNGRSQRQDPPSYNY